MAVVKSPKNIKRKKLWVNKNVTKLNLYTKFEKKVPFFLKKTKKSYKLLKSKRKIKQSLKIIIDSQRLF